MKKENYEKFMQAVFLITTGMHDRDEAGNVFCHFCDERFELVGQDVAQTLEVTHKPDCPIQMLCEVMTEARDTLYASALHDYSGLDIKYIDKFGHVTGYRINGEELDPGSAVKRLMTNPKFKYGQDAEMYLAMLTAVMRS